MANNWFSNILPTIGKAVNTAEQAVGNFSPGNAIIKAVVPGGQNLSPNLPTINQIGQNLSNTQKASDQATQAMIKKVQGKPLTPQDNAARQKDNENTAGIVTGAMTGPENVVGKVVAPDVTKSLFGLEHTQNIQDALTRNGVNDYTQIGQAAHNLYNNTINPALSLGPKLVKIDEVTKGIVDEMRRIKPGLDPVKAKQAAYQVINDMYNVGRESSNQVVPSHVDTPSLFGIKQDLNKTGAVKDYFNGAPTPTDLVDLATVAGRNAISKIIQVAHPEIAAATKDYGLLQDAVPSIYKATEQAANAPKLNKVQQIIQGVKSNPVGYGVLALGGTSVLPPIVKGGASVAGAVASQLPSIENTAMNALGYAPKDNANSPEDQKQGANAGSSVVHGGIIDQPFSNVKPNTDGTYSLPQAAPDGQNQRHYTTAQDYQNSLATLAQQYPAGDKDPAYSVAKTQIDAQYHTDQQQANEVFQGNNIKNFMDNATTYNADGNTLLNTLSSMPNAQGFWNGVSKAGSIRAYTDPKFANELQQIDSFNNEYSSAYESVTGKKPTDNQLLSSANSAGQAVKKYNAMMQFISGTYGKYVNPYLALTSGTGTQTRTGAPLPIINNAPSPAPQDASGMVQGGLQQTINNLPAIQ